MLDPVSRATPWAGVWATDATDRVVFIHPAPSGGKSGHGDILVGMHALDSPSPTLDHVKPWYRQARVNLKPCQYGFEVPEAEYRPQTLGGWLTPMVDSGRFAGMLCTVGPVPPQGLAPAEAGRTLDTSDTADSDERFAVWEVDARTGRLHSTGSLEDIFGHARGSVGTYAADYLRIVHRDDRLRVAQTWRKAVAQPAAALKMEFRAICKDGSERWLSVAGMPKRDASGAASGVWGVIRDVTAGRQAEAALRASEALYRSVVDYQTEVISRFLPDGTLVFVNEPYSVLFGKQTSDLLGHRWHPVAHPDDVPMIEARLRSMSPQEPVVVIDNRVFVADGSLRWMQFVNRGIYDADGKLMHVQSVGRDLTRLKTIEAELREGEERLKMALAGAAQVSWDWNLQESSVGAPGTWHELLGHTEAPPPTSEDDWWSLVHPEDIDQLRHRMKAYIAGESAQFESEHRLRHQAGHWIWVEARGKVTQRGDSGRPVRMVGTLRDITQQRRLHEEGVGLLKRIETLICNATQGAPASTASELAIQELTPREREILILIAKGMTSAQIGRHLHLSTNTVASHRRNLMAKLDVHSSVEVARFVHQHGLASNR